MKSLISFLSLAIVLAASSMANANTMCTPTDVTLDFVQLADASEAPVIDVVTGAGIPASDCLILLGNDKPLPKGSNIGTYQDGFMNGEGEYFKYFDPFYLGEGDDDNDGFNDDLAFIDPTTDLQNLDGNGGLDDPGWIYLGKDDGAGFGVGEEPVEVGKGIDGGVTVSNALVDINFICEQGTSLNGDNCTKGTWSIEPDEDIAQTLEELLGDGVFDHLALVFKTGNVCHEYAVDKPNKCIDDEKSPEFAIYDFDFGTLLGNAALEFPYNLGGSFDLSNTFHGTALSHFSVWVRDPAFDDITTRTISEPSANLFLVLGILMILGRYRSNRGVL
jgi:hypothetical protein